MKFSFMMKYHLVAQIKRPSSLIYLGDYTPNDSAMGSMQNVSGGGLASTACGFTYIKELNLANGNNTWAAVHNSGTNFLYVDGHADYRDKAWCINQKSNYSQDGNWEFWKTDKN